MKTHLIEVNFDGLVGPTHHYGGLGVGNLASRSFAGQPSDPRAAALQGLEKIERVVAEGDPERVRQAVLPPPPRPDIPWLRQFGFKGDDGEVLAAAAREAPRLLSAAWSASAMWTANAATVSPAADCGDVRAHLTVANLVSSLHRSVEPESTYQLLCRVFSDRSRFQVHRPLDGGAAMRDEGAANHMRLCDGSGAVALEVFVHGDEGPSAGWRFQPRQSAEACRAVARLHGLDPTRTFLLAQHPEAIDAGAFHNDVVATSHGDVLLYHEQAFLSAEATLQRMADVYERLCGRPLWRLEISRDLLPLDAAVASYLFNSQLIPHRDGGLALICPIQCQQVAAAQNAIQDLLEGPNPIRHVAYVDLRQSMSNGGGPACLRLRAPLEPQDISAIHPGVMWSSELAASLRDVIERHYRRHVTAADLTDPAFAAEAHHATAAIWSAMGLADATSSAPRS